MSFPRELIVVAMFLFVMGAKGATFKLADQPIVIFDRIKTTDGLSPGGVTSIIQDHLGFIWIGTQEGLNHYDGYRIENYYHEKGDTKSLLNDNIWSLLSDSSNRLWIGTDSGLNLYNHDSKEFSRFDLGLESPVGQRNAVFVLFEDNDGNVWVGNGFGLTRIGLDDELKYYQYDIINNSIGKGSVRAIYQSSDGLLWIGTEEGGISVYDPLQDLFENISETLPDKNVRHILEDDFGRIWVATYSGGLAIFDKKTAEWRHVAHQKDNPKGISSNRVRTLLKDRSGSVWVGTDQGLNLWQPQSDDFERYVTDPTNQRSISENTIVTIFQDAGGVIWVGTLDGVNKWNADVESFPHYRLVSGSRDELTSSSVTSFAESPNGDVWIGNFAGLNRWNSSVGKLESYPAQEIGLSDSRVMSLLNEGETLLVGTMAGGLSEMRNNEIVRTHVNDPDNPSSISSNAVSKIFRDSQNRVWLSTYGGGVNQYLGEGKFRRFPDASNPHGSFSDLRCVDIREAEDGNLWVATDGGGIVVLDPDTGDTKNFRHNPEDPTSISSNNTITLLMTEDAVWVGSRDRGVNKFDLDSQSFTSFNKSDGLSSDSVYGILEDERGAIWMSSGKGLSVLDPITSKVTLYDSTHGLQSDDFHSNAFLKLSDGTLLFGGTNGFNAFRPQRIGKNENTPSIRLTSFSKFNKEVKLPLAIDRMKSIELAYNDSVIGFEFSSLDYTAPEKNQYQFMLDGFNDDWVESGTSRKVTYTNLDPGRYTFKVRGSNNDGVWNQTGAQIGVVVRPPLWATWWAYATYAILAALAIYALVQANLNRLRREEQKRYAERLQLYIESLEEATDCVLIADENVKLIYANDAINTILGRSPAEALGNPLYSILFQQDADRETAEAELEDSGRYHGEVEHKDNEGDVRTTEITIAPVKQSFGERGSGYVSITRDVTDRKRTEAELDNHRKNLVSMVDEKTSALEREMEENREARKSIAESLQEKELLLKEVHHRVKNNMQVISSLLNIQAESAGNEQYTMLLGESQQRIKSMSLIHESLYQSDNLLEINFEEYINMLANSLCRFYTVPGVSVFLDIDVQNVLLDIETAVPCGLIINELVSNSLKHAFNEEQSVGTISISFLNVGCSHVLRIGDDGVGLPDDFDLDTGSSMGMEIVSILTQQLDGQLSVVESKGAGFEISFPRKEEHV
jgi:PAS domain S-box-containing protein